MRVGETEFWGTREQAAEHGLRLASLKSIGGTLLYESPISLNSTVISGDCSVGFLTYVGAGSRITMTDIGRYCSVAPDVTIGAAEHPLDWVSTHPFQYDGTRQFDGVVEYASIVSRVPFPENNKRTTVGNDVLIGDGAFIKRGITVGHGAVIGARAVVTQNVAPYSIVAGNPARPIRDRFDSDLIHRLLSSEWWQHDLSTVSAASFKDPASFLDALDVSLANKKVQLLSVKRYRLNGGNNPKATRLL